MTAMTTVWTTATSFRTAPSRPADLTSFSARVAGVYLAHSTATRTMTAETFQVSDDGSCVRLVTMFHWGEKMSSQILLGIPVRSCQAFVTGALQWLWNPDMAYGQLFTDEEYKIEIFVQSSCTKSWCSADGTVTKYERMNRLHIADLDTLHHISPRKPGIMSVWGKMSKYHKI